MIVCLCRGVSDRLVRQAAASGARTLEQVGAACGAGRGCGGCHRTIGEIVAGAQAAAPCALAEELAGARFARPQAFGYVARR